MYKTVVSITVRDIVNSPDLGTRVIAGASGLDRAVGWAHVCELADPTEWLSEGELLMTVGHTIPKQPSEQESYIERLARARLSGLVIAEGMLAPELSGKLRSAADRCSFPVLLNAYEIPYTSVVRAVADANRGAEHARLLQILRVYEKVRLAVGGESGSELIGQLGSMVGCDLFVIDPESGRSMIPDISSAPVEVFRALRKALDQRFEPMPAILRLDAAQRLAVTVPVPASRSTALVAVIREESMPQTSILHHIAAVAALEVEKLAAEYERKRQLGSELLAGLTDRRLATDLAEHLLAERQLSEEPRLLAACPGDVGKNEHSDLHLRLEDRGVPHLLLRRTPILTALLPATPGEIDAFREELGSAFPVGLSDPVGNLSRIPDAYREAQWALQSATATNKAIMKYGEESALSPFLPRTLGSAHRIVDHILGPLLEYDSAHDSQLVLSLRTFLSNQRSWQRAAASLHVHRQTLVYRMRRVEELTGRRLDETEDVAELWLALRAAEYSGDTTV